MTNFDANLVHKEIVQWTKDWFAKNGGEKPTAVIGISGGKDSSICAAILAEALGPENVVGVMMPNGMQSDIDDSERLIEALGIRGMTVNIGHAYNALFDTIAENYLIDISEGKRSNEWPSLFTTNTPARLRMTTLYGVAAMENGRVCNTCNLSEDFTGWSTKFGDAAGDFSLLGNLTKTEVCELGHTFEKIPSDLVDKIPSDGMCGSSDEDKMGFTYEVLDTYIRTGLKPKSKEVWEKIEKMHNNPNTQKKIVIAKEDTFSF